MIHHVQLACPANAEDLARSFYGDLLGLTEVPKPVALAARGGCWFRGNGIEIHLGVEEPFTPARKAHPGLMWSELDSLAARLTTAGMAVSWSDELPGFRRFYSADCFGNRLEFLAPRDGHATTLPMP